MFRSIFTPDNEAPPALRGISIRQPMAEAIVRALRCVALCGAEFDESRSAVATMRNGLLMPLCCFDV